MKRADVEKFAAAVLPLCIEKANGERAYPKVPLQGMELFKTMERAAVLARVAAIAMAKELDGGDWDDAQENLASPQKQESPRDVGGAIVYSGPLDEGPF